MWILHIIVVAYVYWDHILFSPWLLQPTTPTPPTIGTTGISSMKTISRREWNQLMRRLHSHYWIVNYALRTAEEIWMSAFSVRYMGYAVSTMRYGRTHRAPRRPVGSVFVTVSEGEESYTSRSLVLLDSLNQSVPLRTIGGAIFNKYFFAYVYSCMWTMDAIKIICMVLLGYNHFHVGPLINHWQMSTLRWMPCHS